MRANPLQSREGRIKQSEDDNKIEGTEENRIENRGKAQNSAQTQQGVMHHSTMQSGIVNSATRNPVSHRFSNILPFSGRSAQVYSESCRTQIQTREQLSPMRQRSWSRRNGFEIKTSISQPRSASQEESFSIKYTVTKREFIIEELLFKKIVCGFLNGGVGGQFSLYPINSQIIDSNIREIIQAYLQRILQDFRPCPKLDTHLFISVGERLRIRVQPPSPAIYFFANNDQYPFCAKVVQKALQPITVQWDKFIQALFLNGSSDKLLKPLFFRSLISIAPLTIDYTIKQTELQIEEISIKGVICNLLNRRVGGQFYLSARNPQRINSNTEESLKGSILKLLYDFRPQLKLGIHLFIFFGQPTRVKVTPTPRTTYYFAMENGDYPFSTLLVSGGLMTIMIQENSFFSALFKNGAFDEIQN